MHPKSVNWEHLPDRNWIQRHYLPQLSGSVLYIGVDFYTAFYGAIVRDGALFTTLDVDAAKAPFGSIHQHFVEDYRQHQKLYDHVCLYGVLGWSIRNDPPEAHYRKLDTLVKPGGTLMLGNHVHALESFDYWKKSILSSPTLRTYELLEREVRSVTTNYIWWGQKPKEGHVGNCENEWP